MPQDSFVRQTPSVFIFADHINEGTRVQATFGSCNSKHHTRAENSIGDFYFPIKATRRTSVENSFATSSSLSKEQRKRVSNWRAEMYLPFRWTSWDESRQFVDCNLESLHREMRCSGSSPSRLDRGVRALHLDNRVSTRNLGALLKAPFAIDSGFG